MFQNKIVRKFKEMKMATTSTNLNEIRKESLGNYYNIYNLFTK